MKFNQTRVRAEDHGIVGPLHANISCAPSFMSVFAHFLLLDYVQEMIVFMSNALLVLLNQAPPLFPIKGDENGKSGRTTIRAWIKYIIVEIFGQIGRGLNNVLTKDVLHLRHITRKYDHFLYII